MDKSKEQLVEILTEKLKLLQLGECTEETVNSVMNLISLLSQDILSECRIEVAQLFEEILRSIQKIYCNEEYAAGRIPKEIEQRILNLYGNISAIGTEATEEEARDGSVILVMFLHFLETHNGINDSPSYHGVQMDVLKSYVESLSDLDDIRFIFDIRMETDDVMFPIEEMLAYVIQDTNFLGARDKGLQLYHVHIFSFAVRFFKKGTDKDELLNDLITNCNLRFIDYLHPGDRLVDTTDLLNYSKNGVMIFIKEGSQRKVLIRSNRKSYFSEKILRECGLNPIEEVSKDKTYSLGWFVERDLEYDTFTNATELLKDKNNREKVLRLFFAGYRNIFLRNSLYEDEHGGINPVNIFSKGDEYIIQDEKHIKRDDIEKVFERYYNLPLKISNVHFFNRVFIGTFISLMRIDDLPAEKLLSFSYSEDDIYQSQLIDAWIFETGNNIIKIGKLLSEWYEELLYCIRSEPDGRQNESPCIQEHDIKPQRFFPFSYDFRKILQILSEKYNSNDCYIYSSTMHDEDGEKTVVIQKDKKSKVLSERNIIDQTERFKGIYDGQRVFVIECNGKYYLDDQRISEALYNLRTIWANCIDYEIISSISWFLYNETVDRMRLHQRGLSGDIGPSFYKESFEDQAYYRILHNMLRYGVRKDRIVDYFRIINYHEKMEFSEISDNVVFQSEDPNTLYVPKNGSHAESALYDVYEKYLRDPSRRNENNLYNDRIDYDSDIDRYLIHGNEIKHIVILCDNFESGGQTVRVLKAYLEMDLDKDGVAVEYARRHRYYLSRDEHEISLKDIISKNECDLSVYGYYGTDSGKVKIQKFLDFVKAKGKADYCKPISKQIDSIYDTAVDIFGEPEERISKRAFAVIREFNMTKCNVFPNDMLTDPKKAITMFLKKVELEVPQVNRIVLNSCAINILSVDESIKALTDYFKSNGFTDRDRASAATLTMFSVLPLSMRIEVMENLLEEDHNPVVLEKLVKAYAKDGKMKRLLKTMRRWVDSGYTTAEYAERLTEAAKPLYMYRDKLPIADNLSVSRDNFKTIVDATEAPEEFLDIMRSILGV